MCSTRGRANCAVHNSKAEFYHGIFSSFERKRSGSRFHEGDSRLNAAHEEPTNVEGWEALVFQLRSRSDSRIPDTLDVETTCLQRFRSGYPPRDAQITGWGRGNARVRATARIGSDT